MNDPKYHLLGFCTERPQQPDCQPGIDHYGGLLSSWLYVASGRSVQVIHVVTFGNVEPSRTHEKLPYDPCSLWSSVVQAGSVGLNHSELMTNCPMIVISSGAQRFQEVW